MVDWLNTAKVSSNACILSYYVDAARPQPPTTSEIFRAFIKQITIHYKDTGTSMPTDLRFNIKAVLESTTSMRTTIPEFIIILQRFVQLQSSCYIVVDGIDALRESEIQIFVNSLRQMWSMQSDSNSNGRLILFCRETLGRRIRLESIPKSIILQIKLEHLKSDIHSYVDSQVDAKQRESPITGDNILVDEVKSALKSNSEKM